MVLHFGIRQMDTCEELPERQSQPWLQRARAAAALSITGT